MFLDRSWPIRGGAAYIYYALNTHLTNRNNIYVYIYIYKNEVFYSYREKEPR